MFGALVNRPNKVQAKQVAFQAQHVPVYLRGNGKYYYRKPHHLPSPTHPIR
ncbi:hypothetical protein B9479_008077 [Cryptococcus floricola]|uniref:Uncharacterized protein n=1 Tax=Cryptococcus floricola TaxID=2591691 RepID=A0A5D3AM99_9TREE|nr:hypothetical protein B9479_008077 [Cryptococcus floricola]